MSFDIPNNGVYELSFLDKYLEPGIDVVQLNKNPNTNMYPLTESNYLLNSNSSLFPDNIRFTSDGSVVEAGFRIFIEPKGVFKF